VVVIMMGFPTAFTLMGLGMMFGFDAFYDPTQPLTHNHIFDLMVQRSYGAMTNDTLLSIPLFVLMGYVMERGALVDKMFYSIQLAFRRVPASLAVATLIVCTFWGIASGLVGAVVVLMGVIAMGPMLKAGYDVRLASGVITAGGTLGILIPPSVMIIVYAAVAGQSVVKLYASAMFPGFFLSFLYLAYIIGWALINPKIAPKLPESEMVVPVPGWVSQLGKSYSGNLLAAFAAAIFSPAKALALEFEGRRVRYAMLAKGMLVALVPVMLWAGTFGGLWWYVVIHQQTVAQELAGVPREAEPAREAAAQPPTAEEKPKALGQGQEEPAKEEATDEEAAGGVRQLGDPELGASRAATPAETGAAPPEFYTWFWGCLVFAALLLAWYYRKFNAEQWSILGLLTESVMPLGILTVVVLGVILFGITTATESAGIGAAGAFLLALQARTLDWEKVKQSMFLTAKTTAMVCWLFVGSALFSAVFAILGGQQLVEKWVLALNMTPVQFMLLSQAIIFVLGWPLEWTEIIVIFVPIFLPMLSHFNIDPILWGTLVFVNLQAAFLSPPVAMSAFYLKGVAPAHVTLNQIFAGMMPYMLVVILCMVIMYLWPGMTLWLPNYLYGS
jgi:TRAP-type mannitol/chloroaromatic compound transport system permease large subunit